MDYNPYPNGISFIVKLNRNGYESQDIDDLFSSDLGNLAFDTEVGYKWNPSAVDQNFLTLTLVAVEYLLDSIASGFLNQLGADLHNWSKKSLSKVLCKKPCVQANINFIFKDSTISIYTYDEKTTILAMEQVKEIIELAKTKKSDENNNIRIDFNEENSLFQ